jgi:hypothetical protein
LNLQWYRRSVCEGVGAEQIHGPAKEAKECQCDGMWYVCAPVIRSV